MEEVKVYMIANLQIHDADKYREYEKGFFPLLKKHSGEFITCLLYTSDAADE